MKFVEETPLRKAPCWSRRLGQGALAGGSLLLAGQAQAQVKVQPQPGTLYLSDFFKSNQPDQMSHGEIVERSALSSGFSGPIVRHEVPDNPLTEKAHRLGSYLDQRQFTPEEMRTYLGSYAEQCQVGQMQSATADLRMWLEQGAHHSSINLSRGCGQAQVVEAIYHQVNDAWGFEGASQVASLRRLNKVAAGLEVDVPSLLSRDPQVAGPARQEFQQKLVDLVARASQHSPLLAQAQSEYDEVVNQLAQSKVSITVAAANSGTLLDEMAREAYGLRLHTPANFWNNRLANAQVVTVGGTSQGRVAPYTNPDPGIDFWADGDARVDPKDPSKLVNYGTSFAAPRLGVLLSRAHQLHPDWSNQQAEQFLREHLTAPLDNQTPAIDPAAAHDYLIAPGRS
ncbi:MAG: S8 family serine peptidase [Vulcanimicrobiota bacterium]